MNRLRQRLSGPRDAGISIVEVVVALSVFAIAAAGLSAGAVSIVRITSDNRARQVATQLAAADLDQARTAANPLDVVSRAPYTDSTTDPTHTFTITRTASSVTADGTDTACGANINFGYRRVTATVSWLGQLATTKAVRSDTILAPGTPAVDAGTGAISVRVIGVDGQPRSGVDVTVTPVPGPTGGQPLSSQPEPTNSEGCTYADRVVPGAYKIALSKTDYVDTTQDLTPTTTATVTAGSTYGLPAIYDLEGNFVTNYAKNYTGGGTVTLPSNLKASFVPNLSALKIAMKPAVDGATQPLYPGGYQVVAGEFADTFRAPTCASTDPQQWPAGSVSGVTMAQGVRASASALSGQTATFAVPTTPSIPMGVVKVTGVPGVYLTAKAATPAGVGNPGCGTAPADLIYGKVGSSGIAYLAMPFGSWSVYQGATAGALGLQIPALSMTVLTNNDANGVTTSGLGATVTLDPRQVGP